jgi:RHS repeat-associated protein
VRSSTPTPWRLLTSLQTCLWAVLVLCLGSVWASRFVPSDLHKSELVLESSFTEGCRYHYNALGQMDSTVDSRVGAVVNAYDALGRLKTITRPTGVATTYSYSLRGLQDTVLHKKGSTELARFVYTYDRSGLRIGSSDVFGSTTTPVIWNHDSLMRLTQETKSGVAQSWAYDAVSNRTSQVAGGNTVAATFDIRDRMTSLGTTTYTWDVAGRLASRNVSGVGTTRLGWQDDDRLRRVDLPNGNVVDYTYDAQGLMATRTDASGTERYTWDGTLPYGQMIATTNASGALQAREVWGTDHLAEIRNDTILWLLTDGLGHVRAITDSVGKIIGRQDFDAWGNRTLDSGRTVRFGYRGEWSDPATGMVYLRARWMDPTTGRFVSEDPLQGEPNMPVTQHRFHYVGSSPINFVDPSGEMLLAGQMVGSSVIEDVWGTINAFALSIGKNLIARTIVKSAIAFGAGALTAVMTRKLAASYAEGGLTKDEIEMRAKEYQRILGVPPDDGSKSVLYHYTNEEAALEISATRMMKVTPKYLPARASSWGIHD